MTLIFSVLPLYRWTNTSRPRDNVMKNYSRPHRVIEGLLFRSSSIGNPLSNDSFPTKATASITNPMTAIQPKLERAGATHEQEQRATYPSESERAAGNLLTNAKPFTRACCIRGQSGHGILRKIPGGLASILLETTS